MRLSAREEKGFRLMRQFVGDGFGENDLTGIKARNNFNQFDCTGVF